MISGIKMDQKIRFFLGLFILFFLVVPRLTYAQTSQISGLAPDNEQIATFPINDPTFIESPDGQHVIYLAQPFRGFFNRLYSASTSGERTAIELTSEETGGAINYKISPDSQNVVFRSSNGFYSVPITGGTPVKLNTFDARQQVFDISPDSQRVVILNFGEIWSIPISGGENTLITVNQPENGFDIDGFKISPDSKFVVYRFSQMVESGRPIIHLFRASILGGEPVLDLLAQADDIESVLDFSFSPNSEYIVYNIFTLTDLNLAVNSVSIEGGPTNRLSGVPNGDGGGRLLSILNDSERVYYSFGDTFATFNRIFSVPIDGSVSAATEIVNIGGNRFGFTRVLNEGQRILLSSEDSSSGLQSVALIDLSNNSNPLVTLGSVVAENGFSSIAINDAESAAALLSSSFDSSSGMFQTTITSLDLINGLFITTLERDTSAQSLLPLFNSEILIDSSGETIVFAEQTSVGNPGIVSALPLSGGQVETLSAPEINGPTVFNYAISNDGLRVFFIAGRTSGVTDEAALFVVDIPEQLEESGDLCFPLLINNGGAAIICL